MEGESPPRASVGQQNGCFTERGESEGDAGESGRPGAPPLPVAATPTDFGLPLDPAAATDAAARGGDAPDGAVREGDALVPPDGSPRHLWASYGRTVARLRRVAYRVLRDEHEAEDAAHDAFVAARRSLTSLRDPALIDHWLVRIAKNAASTRLRRRLRMTPDHRIVAEEPPPGWEPPRVMFRSGSTEPPPESVAALRAEFEGVPEPWRRAFLARVLRGLSIEEIAVEQGVTPACVKTRISRVRSRLRRSL